LNDEKERGISDAKKLKSVLMDYLHDYNVLLGAKEMSLILSQDAIKHITQLVGPSGM